MKWLEAIINKILALLPATEFVEPTDEAIRVTCFGSRQRIKDLGPGWYVIWPLIQYILHVPVKLQTADIRNQSAMTRDKVDLTVSGALVYKIYNARKASIEVEDYDKSMITIALGMIRKYISKHTLDELVDMDELTDKIRRELHDTCTKWGIKIINVEITDFGRARNLRLLTNGPSEMEKSE
jgi:regulator of protease activity HflC (stomatin/prohibitin superfamily)